MSLSVTCQCGARLEIDEKFLGKEISCPDCQRPLPTKPPPAPTTLELPDYRRVSSMSALSLTLALIGTFTPLTIVAIVLGVLGIREIKRRPSQLKGIALARAGMIVGAAGTVVTLAALIWPPFGMDVFLRELALVRNIEYTSSDVFKSEDPFADNVQIIRLSNLWGKYRSPTDQSQNRSIDRLVLIDVADDAFIASQKFPEMAPEGDERKQKILESLYKSELVNLLGRLNGKPLGSDGKIVEEKAIADNNTEIVLDLRDRRFLIRYPTLGVRLDILVGAARKNRFNSLQDDFRKAFDSVKNR